MLALSIIGFADAAFLTMKWLFGSPITCYAFNGCESVLHSAFGNLFGVPLSVLGALFYALMVIAITYYLQYRAERAFAVMIYGALWGGLFSVYLFALQAFVIDAWCFYCVISGAVGLTNAMLATRVMRSPAQI